MLLQIEASALPSSTRWLRSEDASDAALALQVKEKADADFVRALSDGCLHVHLRAPLAMTPVRIWPLELRGGEHVFPAECR